MWVKPKEVWSSWTNEEREANTLEHRNSRETMTRKCVYETIVCVFRCWVRLSSVSWCGTSSWVTRWYGEELTPGSSSLPSRCWRYMRHHHLRMGFIWKGRHAAICCWMICLCPVWKLTLRILNAPRARQSGNSTTVHDPWCNTTGVCVCVCVSVFLIC